MKVKTFYEDVFDEFFLRISASGDLEAKGSHYVPGETLFYDAGNDDVEVHLILGVRGRKITSVFFTSPRGRDR